MGVNLDAAWRGGSSVNPATGGPLDVVRFRAYGANAQAAEPLPTASTNHGSNGTLSAEERAKLLCWWQFFRKPKLETYDQFNGQYVDYVPQYESISRYFFPDQSYHWIKRPIGPFASAAFDGYFSTAGNDVHSGISAEWGINTHGVWERTIPEQYFATGGGVSLYPGQEPQKIAPFFSAGLPPHERFVYTSFIKFTWGGWMVKSPYAVPSTGPPYPAGYYCQSGGGVSMPVISALYGGATANHNNNEGGCWVTAPTDYYSGAPANQPAGYTPPLDASGYRTQEGGQLTIAVAYGYYDPGPQDTFKLFRSWQIPIQSVLKPDLFYDSRELDPANGNAGKYTLVVSCDGVSTSWGLIQGHSGSNVEWFARIDPFIYDSGPGGYGPGSAANTLFDAPSSLGTMETGGYLGNDQANWNGFINEWSMSSEPYDTITLGKLGNLRPDFGYPHLESARFRPSG